ncbi:MAG: hypothetical protein IT518_24590 [Burkholderiales bacterium]|nr:hypothetical protein [Burkholderiales bacterium]
MQSVAILHNPAVAATRELALSTTAAARELGVTATPATATDAVAIEQAMAKAAGDLPVQRRRPRSC